MTIFFFCQRSTLLQFALLNQPHQGTDTSSKQNMLHTDYMLVRRCDSRLWNMAVKRVGLKTLGF